MRPALAIGTIRPALSAATRADAALFATVPRWVGALLPFAAAALVTIVAALHALAPTRMGEDYLPTTLLATRDVYGESMTFLLAALVLGIVSPASGVLLVLVHIPLDLLAASRQLYELEPMPSALIGRLVADWVLWLLVVSAPLLGRTIGITLAAGHTGRAATLRSVGGAAVATGLAVLVWTAAYPLLIRPPFDWSRLSTPNVDAVATVQAGGLPLIVVAVIGAAVIALVHARRGTGLLVEPEASTAVRAGPLGGISRSAPARFAMGVMGAALLVIGFGGIVSGTTDVVVLFVAFVLAGPVAGVVMERRGGFRPDRAVASLAAASLAAAAVAAVVAGALFGVEAVSEYFPIVLAVALAALAGAVGRILLAGRRAPAGPGLVASAMFVAALVFLATPAPVAADNCDSLGDCFATLSGAAAAAAALAALAGILNGPPRAGFGFAKKPYAPPVFQSPESPLPPRPELRGSSGSWGPGPQPWKSAPPGGPQPGPPRPPPTSDGKPIDKRAFPSAGAGIRA